MRRVNKIIVWSNSIHEKAGYSGQIYSLIPFLQADGYEVAVVANSGLSGQAIHWKGVDIYPTRGNPYDFDMVAEYADHFKADVVLSLYDLFAMPEDTRQKLRKPWIAWCPVDGVPVAPRIVAAAKGADYLLSMSRFGQGELEQAGLQPTYVPLGVNCDVFCPGDKAEARKELGFHPDGFVVGVVAANKGWPCRKSWPELIEAFAHFYHRHPRESLLYLHTTRLPYGTREGANISQLVARVGLPKEKVMITQESDIAIGIQDETMAQLYRSFDVLLSPSMAEGFGCPIVEAQACGTPVITQDCTAMTEHTWLGQAIQPLQRFYVPQLDYFWYLASVERIAAALEQEYQARTATTDPRKVKQVVHKVQQTYHWPTVYERHWKPLLERIEAETW